MWPAEQQLLGHQLNRHDLELQIELGCVSRGENCSVSVGARARAHIFEAVPNDHVVPRIRWPKYIELHVFIALGLDFKQQRAATDRIKGDAEAFLLLHSRVYFAEAVCLRMYKC